jgi:hypothetical protein
MAVSGRRWNRRRWWSTVSVGTVVVVWVSLALGRDAGRPTAPSPVDAGLMESASTPGASSPAVAEPNAPLWTTRSPAGVLGTAGAVATTLLLATAATAAASTTSVPAAAASSTAGSNAAGSNAAGSDATGTDVPTTETSPVDAGAAAPWCQEAGQAALARLGYPWQERLPGWTVTFLPGRSGLLGGTWTYEHRIEIYVRDGQTVDDVAFTLAHELGHAVDVSLFSDGDRREWVEARHLDSAVPWWVESGATDFSSGAGDWAEAFAVFQVGGDSHSQVAGQPAGADLAVVARLSRA